MYQNFNASDQYRRQYELYQKESQTVNVISTDSEFFVSIPQLVPNFQNISLDTPQHSTYQLRSFQFFNTFSNIEVGDTIRLRISLGWQKITTTGNTYSWNGVPGSIQAGVPVTQMAIPNEPIDIDLSRLYQSQYGTPYVNDTLDVNDNNSGNGLMPPTLPLQAQTLTGAELADLLNKFILEEAYSLYHSQQYYPDTAASVCYQNLVYFAGACSFQFDTTSNKLQVRYDLANYIKLYKDYFADSEQELPATLRLDALTADQFWGMTFVNVELGTIPSDSSLKQKRLGRYFGLQSVADEVTSEFHPVNMFEGSQYYGSIRFGREIFEMMVMERLMTLATVNGEWTAFTNNLALNNEGMHAASQMIVTRTFPKAMNVYRHRYIYIRTSLNTNFWSKDGSRSDTLDIIPITKGLVETGEYHSHSGRIYEAKDTNLNSFMIYFANEENERIIFNDPYILNLALFLSPSAN